MPFCSFCGSGFDNSKYLFLHLKHAHNCNNSTALSCAKNECYRKFSSFKTFKQHFSKHHSCSELEPNMHISNQDLPLTDFRTDLKYSGSQRCESNYSKFEEKLDANVLHFISKLYSDHSLPRKKVLEIIKDILHLLKDPFNLFEQFIVETCDKSSEREIAKYFQKVFNLFSSFSSEHLTFKYLEDNGFFIRPEEYLISEKIENKKKTRI